MKRKSQSPAAPTEQDLQRAFRLMNTPVGRALRKPGATFRIWTNTSPSNIWVETKTGRYAHHSGSGSDCPVRQAFLDLKPFMDQLPATQGESVYRLKEDFLARFEQKKMDKRLPKSTSAPKRVRF